MKVQQEPPVPYSHRAKEEKFLTVEIRWDEKAGLRTGCGVRSQVIDVLEAQEIKETGVEEGYHCCGKGDEEFFPTEADDWSGLGRPMELVLIAYR